MNYFKLYHQLCSQRSKTKVEWENRESNLHRHHVIPTHSGGENVESNYVYLTVREHALAHRLLWKMNGNPNDLRSMRMLGAKLTIEQRRTVGKWCHANGIGLHNEKWNDHRIDWRRKAVKTQISRNSGIHDRDNPEYSRWRSEAGKLGAKTQIQSGLGIHTADQEKRRIWAKAGGVAAGLGKKWMTRGDQRTRVLKQFVDQYVADGWTLGMAKLVVVS